MRIGVLTNDPALAEQLVQLLEDEGHQCYVYRSERTLVGFMSHETIDVLLVDSRSNDSLRVIKRIRSENPSRPAIVILVSLGAEAEIDAALNAGVDGYALRPPQRDLLIARIEALYRRSSAEQRGARTERFGAYEFDKTAGMVRVRGKPVHLSARQFALALMLFREANRTLSRSYLFETLWGRDLGAQSRTLDTHVSKLRAKLGLQLEDGFRLITVYGRGYRLEAAGIESQAEEDDDLDRRLRSVAARR